jgi:ornithine carbamoyltransferase
VINGLTDRCHPCQMLADLQTFHEHRGDIQGKRVAWIGDGNNMCHSFMEAAQLFDFELRVACPEGFEPDADLLAACGGRCTILRDPREAAEGAHLIATDVWASMGQEEEQERRKAAFAAYQVTDAIMAQADATTPSSCTACPRIAARKSPPRSSTARVRWSGTRPRTGCMPRKALLEFLIPH